MAGKGIICMISEEEGWIHTANGGKSRRAFLASDFAHMTFCIFSILWQGTSIILFRLLIINEPPCGKTNNVVSEQVPHKPACTVTEKS